MWNKTIMKSYIDLEIQKNLGLQYSAKMDGTVYSYKQTYWHAFTIDGCGLQLWGGTLSTGETVVVNDFAEVHKIVDEL